MFSFFTSFGELRGSQSSRSAPSAPASCLGVSPGSDTKRRPREEGLNIPPVLEHATILGGQPSSQPAIFSAWTRPTYRVCERHVLGKLRRLVLFAAAHNRITEKLSGSAASAPSRCKLSSIEARRSLSVVQHESAPATWWPLITSLEALQEERGWCQTCAFALAPGVFLVLPAPPLYTWPTSTE